MKKTNHVIRQIYSRVQYSMIPSTVRTFSSWLHPLALRQVLLISLTSVGLLGNISASIASQDIIMSADQVHPRHDLMHKTVPRQWEGSPEGIAYSEFNHALAGIGVILIGLSELRTAMGWIGLAWSRWLLPVALVGSGIFLLIWSDHEAWPIGHWTLAETLSGRDPEMLQHKIFGILALSVGTVEWLRRTQRLEHWSWSVLLPGFALVGGMMLFLHMHGPHPAGHQIQIHHHVMGTLALAGGFAWFAGEWIHRPQVSPCAPSHPRPALKILWAVAVIIIGVQLLFYSET